MQEESKEDFLARHRKSLGIIEEEEPADQPGRMAGLRKWMYLILLLTFIWMIYQMFGMMKSN
ncbi:MAG: hypothetical protein JNL60_05900 [Bacteroidia bacterium]|nr:hypothetical protein [Bacteroidia bacterium]